MYSGTSTLLETDLVCYEAADTNCSWTTGDTGTSVTLPLSRIKRTHQLSGTGTAVVSSGTLDQFDTFGNPSSHAVYDFASGTAYGALLQTTATSYYQPYSQGTMELPTGVTVMDGSSQTIASTSYQYTSTVTATSGTPSHVSTQAFNVLSIGKWVSGSLATGTYLTSNYTYYDTGNVKTATDANSTSVTTNTYGNCGNSFLTGTSTPVKSPSGTTTATLTTGAGWNCIGGVRTSTTDVNSKSTTYSYGSDPYWRATSVTDPGGNVTSYSYPQGSSPNTYGSSMTFNSSGSVNGTVITTDGLGRTLIQQKQQTLGSNPNYDSVALSYDSRGRQACQTQVPYSGSIGQYNAPGSSNGVCTTYDALNRPTSITDAGGATTSYTYSINTSLHATNTYLSLGPAPGTETPKQRLFGYNGAGQLTSVCEVNGLAGNGSCGTGSGYDGYLTKYTYDGPNLTQTQQNVQSGSSIQTRTIAYDGLGRTTAESIPEWSNGSGLAGSATYTFDTDSECGSTSMGDPIKKIDNAGDHICNTYDSMHRLLTSSVLVTGTGMSSTPTANYVYDAATCNGNTMQNAKGNLAEAYTGSSSSKSTDLCFSRSLSTSGATNGGVIAKVWEQTKPSGTWYTTTDTYYPNGALGTRATNYASPSITYGLDGEGRPTSATDTTHTLNLVTSASYNPASTATQVTFGNGDSDTFVYDPSANRPTSIVDSVTGSSAFSVTTGLTWNPNWSLQKMQITDTNDSSKNQTCTYSADGLMRIASATCPSAWTQTFTYDAFGNITKTGTGGGTSYAAGYNAATDQVSSFPPPAPAYDKNGDQLNSTGLSSISWNAAGVPVSVTPLSGSAIAGTFDALNRLVGTTAGSTYTEFVYGSDGTKVGVVRGGSLIKSIAPLPGGESAVYNSAGLNFIRHTDWLGSSRLATTWVHGIYAKEAYAPFGEVYNEAGTPDRSFTGQDQDTVPGSGATGIYDVLFRKFDPAAGRWLSPDPLGWGAADLGNPQSLNRYAYVLNSPLRFVDPTGLVAVACDWGSSDNGGEDVDVEDDCAADGGTPVDVTVTVNVNADGGSSWIELTDPSLGIGSQNNGPNGPQGSGHVASCFARGLVVGRPGPWLLLRLAQPQWQSVHRLQR